MYDYFKEKRRKKFDSMIKITTEDAFTLTDGPTIYMTDDIIKVAKFCLQIAKIPSSIVTDIQKNIEYNNTARYDINK